MAEAGEESVGGVGRGAPLRARRARKCAAGVVDAFSFCVGGAVEEYAGSARQIGYRAAAEECPEAIERLLRGHLDGRGQSESLRSYLRRTSDEELRTLLAGEMVVAVARDPAPGRVPANIG